MTLSYTIGDPVDQVPPIVKVSLRDRWTEVYAAVIEARGLWVPVQMPDRVRARNLAHVARKRKGFEAECRGAICFLRVKR